MGRGTSKAGGGNSGVNVLNLANGETIDLSESPLRFGGTDRALAGNARTVIEQFENKKYNLKREQSMLIDKDGNVIETNQGGKGSVKASLEARETADVLTHNHPRATGGLGGTFSDGDLANFTRFNQTTYRATAKEGTYSISKTSAYDGKGLLGALKTFDGENRQNLSKIGDKIAKEYTDGKIDYATANKKIQALNNKSLVNRHNFLLENQKKYGYTYTLERR